jgi:hypothetical protein
MEGLSIAAFRQVVRAGGGSKNSTGPSGEVTSGLLTMESRIQTQLVVTGSTCKLHFAKTVHTVLRVGLRRK